MKTKTAMITIAGRPNVGKSTLTNYLVGEKIAIVSNKPDIATKPLCRDFFGSEIFALGQKDTCPKKPAPDMLYAAMKEIGVDRCIYVGDSEVDVQTAKNAGVPCLSVLWGFRDKACLTKHGAAHFCDDPENLLTCLKEMIKNVQ